MDVIAHRDLKPENVRQRIRQLEAERQEVHDAITNLYWTFTRTARGKPPCVAQPELYVQRRALDERIADLRRQLRSG